MSMENLANKTHINERTRGVAELAAEGLIVLQHPGCSVVQMVWRRGLIVCLKMRAMCGQLFNSCPLQCDHDYYHERQTDGRIASTCQLNGCVSISERREKIVKSVWVIKKISTWVESVSLQWRFRYNGKSFQPISVFLVHFWSSLNNIYLPVSFHFLSSLTPNGFNNPSIKPITTSLIISPRYDINSRADKPRIPMTDASLSTASVLSAFASDWMQFHDLHGWWASCSSVVASRSLGCLIGMQLIPNSCRTVIDS